MKYLFLILVLFSWLPVSAYGWRIVEKECNCTVAPAKPLHKVFRWFTSITNDKSYQYNFHDKNTGKNLGRFKINPDTGEYKVRGMIYQAVWINNDDQDTLNSEIQYFLTDTKCRQQRVRTYRRDAALFKAVQLLRNPPSLFAPVPNMQLIFLKDQIARNDLYMCLGLEPIPLSTGLSPINYKNLLLYGYINSLQNEILFHQTTHHH